MTLQSAIRQLIPISQARLNDEAVPTINARELHRYLGVRAAFKDWIARRIEDYDFQEGKDFCSFLSESTGGRPSREYSISLDMAKELAMVERTAKGKEARQYFIECERQARAAAPVLPQDLPTALRLAADLAEQNAKLEHERDEAIRTKAMIGSSREASAMAAASVASRKVAALEAQLGFNTDHATVTAVEKKLKCVFPKNVYVGMRKWCKDHGAVPKVVTDQRYGQVKAWPAGAWLDVHKIDLKKLFA